jgi:hypothetical protein
MVRKKIKKESKKRKEHSDEEDYKPVVSYRVLMLFFLILLLLSILVGKMRIAYKMFIKNPKIRAHFGDQGVDGKILTLHAGRQYICTLQAKVVACTGIHCVAGCCLIITIFSIC